VSDVVTLSVRTVSDHVALAEIELCGELMIAASAAIGERLSADRIDEVLDVRETTVPRQGDHRG
jgi:tRNA A37 threonylcarbamoyladenosine synthetase subunit TsaC/SUA5/YrdC